MNSKTMTPFLVIALIILSFISGSLWMKLKNLEKEERVEKVEKEEAQPLVADFNPEKKEKPEVKFFVMSFCPFGNQAEAGLKPVAQLLGDKVDWQPVYIVSDAKKSCQIRCANSVYDENRCQQLVDSGRIPDMATCKKYFPYNDKQSCLKEKCAGIKEGEFASLHGDQELHQDIREICAWNMGDEEKWWNFVEKANKNCNSQNADSCWEKQAKEAELDVEAIKKCEQEEGNDLLAQHLGIVEEYGVGGSPTVYINDTLYKGGRQPEDYKKAICAGFKEQPEECKKVLSSSTKGPSTGGCK